MLWSSKSPVRDGQMGMRPARRGSERVHRLATICLRKGSRSFGLRQHVAAFLEATCRFVPQKRRHVGALQIFDPTTNRQFLLTRSLPGLPRAARARLSLAPKYIFRSRV